MGDTILVVGGGGREHALAWALAKSPQVDEVLVAPGNAGTAVEPGCRNLSVKATDIEGVVAAAQEHEVRLVVVGPEDPLVDGLVDACEAAGIPAFGPSAAAAHWKVRSRTARRFCSRARHPDRRGRDLHRRRGRAAHLDTLDAVPVIKASGLAAGKGVIVAESKQEAADAIHDILVDGRFGPPAPRCCSRNGCSAPRSACSPSVTAPTSRSCPPRKTTNACSTVTRAPTRGAWGRSTRHRLPTMPCSPTSVVT